MIRRYGFRKNVSTSNALSDVIETVNNSNFKYLKNFSIVSIDLCKSFYTLYHEILIQKFSIYGIREIALKLLESYLV